MAEKELFGNSEQLDDTISRQAAIDALKMDISIIPFAKAREYVREAIETIYNRLEELPSAQSEIIRCKDCKKNPHWEWVGCPMTGKGERDG